MGILPAIGVFLAGVWPMVHEMGMLNMPLLYLAGVLFLLSLPVGWLVPAIWVTWSNAVYTLVYKRLISATIAAAPANREARQIRGGVLAVSETDLRKPTFR